MDAVRKLNQLVEFAMEATRHYWFSLLCETKTDAVYAFIIAEVVRIGRYSKTEFLPENIHALLT